MNVGTGAVLGLFAGFVLARESSLVLFDSVNPAARPAIQSTLSLDRPLPKSPFTQHHPPPLLPGTGHGRSLVTSMGVGWGVGASWVRCSQDFEKKDEL